MGLDATQKINLPVALGRNVVSLTLDRWQLKGILMGATIQDGVVAGAVPDQEVSTVLIPGLASLMTSVLQDPLVTPATKDQIVALFDTDKDGTITAAEFAATPLIATLLAGDVDLDNDSAPDHLSIGLGFTAKGAVITP